MQFLTKALILLLLLFLACTKKTNPSEKSTSNQNLSSKSHEYNKDNFQRIKLKDFDGKEHSISDYKGKIIVLDFWASWCGPCKKAVPVIEKIRKAVDPQKVVFFGINTDDKELGLDKIRAAATDFGMTYPSLLDSSLILVGALKVQGQPALYIIDKKGELVFSKYGVDSKDYVNVLLKLRELEK